MTALWTLALLAGVLWPGRVLSLLDGAPLSGRTEAALIGVLLPALWWLDRGFLRRPAVRVAVVMLLSLKLTAWVALPQHGLCARFSTGAPFSGNSTVIPIDEPTGSLRSWDLRADWHAPAPGCTAILDRPYRSAAEFPAWFLNLLDAVPPAPHDLALDVTGYVRVDEPGRLVLETGPDMMVTGHIGGTRVMPSAGNPIVVSLAPATHRVEIHASLTGGRWGFVPLWNGRDGWTAMRLTTSPPSRLDRIASGPVAFLTTSLVLMLLTAWSVSALVSLELSAAMAAWILVTACLLVLVGVQGRFERFAGPLLLGGAFVPVATRHRNLRSAFALIGIPWLAFFVGHSWPQIGRVTAYTVGDDWHIFQSAAYRIFLDGYWLEGGSRTFYFQPLYRWVAGVLHLLFGDSSVGELYWDAACLLMAALACFSIVKLTAGFRWALAAAGMTLATFTVGTIWYFVGRGLSEITAAGWMSLGAVFLLRARLGRASAALVAGLFAVLMFYTRLNHLVLALFLPALLLPMRGAPAQWREAWRAARHVNLRTATVYVAAVTTGVSLFAARTWWYTGTFSVLYGTSFPVQKTGLRLTTIGSPAVWAEVGRNLRALVWMNEPPTADPRAILVVLGVVLSLLALIQVPYLNRLPLSIASVTLGAIAGTFVAYAHHYPGRMSIHLIPFAVAMTVCAASELFRAGRAGTKRTYHVVRGAPIEAET